MNRENNYNLIGIDLEAHMISRQTFEKNLHDCIADKAKGGSWLQLLCGLLVTPP